MKYNKDMDGQEQQSFLDAPTIDCKFLPSKKALQFRLNQLVDLIQKGDFDYARYQGWKGLAINISKERVGRSVLIDGEWWHIDQVAGIKRFMATWQSRRQYLLDDAEGVQRSMQLASE